MTPLIASAWAAVWLAVAVGLILLRGRIGRPRASAWLIVIGVALLAIEEPALTLWLGLTGPDGDPDGMSTLVTPMARAHVLDAAIISLAAAAALIALALRGLPKQRRDVWHAL